jgi:hypothetical protein
MDHSRDELSNNIIQELEKLELEKKANLQEHLKGQLEVIDPPNNTVQGIKQSLWSDGVDVTNVYLRGTKMTYEEKERIWKTMDAARDFIDALNIVFKIDTLV